MPSKKYLNISLPRDFSKLFDEIKGKRTDYKSNAEITKDAIRRLYDLVVKFKSVKKLRK